MHTVRLRFRFDREREKEVFNNRTVNKTHKKIERKKLNQIDRVENNSLSTAAIVRITGGNGEQKSKTKENNTHEHTSYIEESG